MLDFLVSSKARRRLLSLLWGADATGSAATLAKRARVGFASAYRELEAMRDLGLVSSSRDHGAQVYRANVAHPLAEALRALVTAPSVEPPLDDASSELRQRLAALGAPLVVDQMSGANRVASAAPMERQVEETLAEGVQLAHRDPTVARSLPVCFYRQRGRLDPQRLREYAVALGEKRSLGFFLTLTGKLAQHAEFLQWAELCRDRRYKAPRQFFYAARTKMDRTASAEKAPLSARQWGLTMNMGLDVFQSTFQKFAHASD